MPDPRRRLRRLTDTRVLARVTAHLTVLALVVLSAGFGMAVTRGEGTSAIPAPDGRSLFDLIGTARAGANDSTSAENQFSADLVPDPSLDGELLNRQLTRSTGSVAPQVSEATPATPAPRASEAPPAEDAGAVEPAVAVQPQPIQAPPPPVVAALVWPVSGGSISQYFHAGHLALDIAAPAGNAVVASAGGLVTFAGWMNNGGGNVIIVDHGGGIQTVYNHLGGFAIGAGAYVGAGQLIGYVGCSGMCTGPHVHYEVIVGGVIVNPLRYL